MSLIGHEHHHTQIQMRTTTNHASSSLPSFFERFQQPSRHRPRRRFWAFPIDPSYSSHHFSLVDETAVSSSSSSSSSSASTIPLLFLSTVSRSISAFVSSIVHRNFFLVSPLRAPPLFSSSLLVHRGARFPLVFLPLTSVLRFFSRSSSSTTTFRRSSRSRLGESSNDFLFLVV